MSLKPFTEQLRSGLPLDKPQVITASSFLFEENHDAIDKADFLVALHGKGETAEELAWFAMVALDRARVHLVGDPRLRKTMVDCCGTGGGGLNIFNVSTCVMFVLAGAGIPVAKHGNRGITKKSGSADVLESLGIKIDLSPEDSERCLKEVGCTFLMAPLYHPCFKAVAPVRKMLAERGQRTVFNLLGPLVNPFKPLNQIVGIFDEKLLPIYSKALRMLGKQNYLAVYGRTKLGKVLGELAVDAPSKLWGNVFGEDYQATTYSECKFDLNTCMVDSAEESARLIESLLEDADREAMDSPRELVLNNAAFAAWLSGIPSGIDEAELMVETSLFDKKALGALNRWRDFSRSLSK